MTYETASGISEVAGTADGIPRVSDLSYPQFSDQFLAPNRPVIVTDAIDHWAALGKWTPEFFRRRYAAMDVGLEGLDMAEFLDLIESASAEPKPYLRNRSIREHFPELESDISPLPDYLRPNWFDSPLVPGRISQHRTDLFIGGPGSKFPYLHFDNYHGYAFLFQIYGEKTYVMYAPDQAPYLYPSSRGKVIANVSGVNDIEHPDLQQFPLFARARGVRCVLRAGEMLFMPSGWWHTARMDTASISVSSNTANACNWPLLMRDHWQHVTTQPHKAIAGALYLRAIWLLESLQDRLFRNRKLHKSG